MSSPLPTWTFPYAACTAPAVAAITAMAASEVPVASRCP
jgi:hypothetical protein